MALYNLLWYQALYQKGIDGALATNFSNYTPPYTYFLALATFTHDLIPPLVAIKRLLYLQDHQIKISTRR
jgi:hypothetical protein